MAIAYTTQIKQTSKRMEPVGKSRYLKLYAPAATEFNYGDPIVITNGLAALAAASATDLVGVSAETKTTHAANVAGVEFLLVDVGVEVPLYRAILSNPLHDSVIATVVTGNQKFAFTAGLTGAGAGADNSVRYSSMLLYYGPGNREHGPVSAYDATGDPAGEQMISMLYPFATTPVDAETYAIFLGDGTAGHATYPGGKINLAATAYKVDGSTYTGPYMIWSLDEAWDGVVLVAITDRLIQAP